MALLREPPLKRVRMSWEEYLELPDQPRAEWVDGVAVIKVAPSSFGHGSAMAEIAFLLHHALPDYHVLLPAALVLPRNRLRIPDLMVIDQHPVGDWVSEPPLMVAEVLSWSTRSEDTVRKSTEYAEGGVGQYWVVDPELRAIDVMGNVEGAWELLAHVDDDRPEAEVDLAGVTVPLDLRALLRG
jgi:Uma2 family endonuclease